MHVVLIRYYAFFFSSFLATGDSYLTLAGRFRLGISMVAEIVKETCDHIWEELQPTYMKPPQCKTGGGYNSDSIVCGNFQIAWVP